MATSTKNLKLVFNVDSNDVTIATDRTLTLTQQLRIFKQELQKLPEGSREFEVLRNKINDTQDSLQRVNTKGGEFFNTLSLLPGPIGDVSNKLDNSIGLLKTFSSFSLKDIGNQFKGLVNDLAGIFDNITGLNKEAGKLADSNSKLGKSTRDAADASKLFDTAAGSQIAAAEEASNSSKNLATSVDKVSDSFKKAAQDQKLMEDGLVEVIDGKLTLKNVTEDFTEASLAEMDAMRLLTTAELNQIPAVEENAVQYALKNKIVDQATLKERALAGGIKQSTDVFKAQTVAETQNTGALAGNTTAAGANAVATGAVTVAQKTATIATRVWTTALLTLKAVLVSLGIGLLIQLLSTGASLLIDFFTGTEKAAEGSDKAAKANEALAKAQEKVRKETERGIATIEAETKAQLTRAKIAGKTEQELFNITQNGIQKRIALLEQANKKLKGAEQNYTDEIIKLRRELQQNLLEFQLEQQKEREKNRKAELDAAIKLEIESENTNRENLKKLLDERLALELKELGNNENQKELARQEYAKKLEDAVNADEKKRNDRKLKELDALAQLEIDKQNTDLETLKGYYDQRLAIELQNEELSEAEKAALREKYAKLANEAINKDTLTRLQTELEANRGNYQEQLRIYQELQTALTTTLNLNEQERAALIKQYQDALLQTLDMSYQNQVDGLNSQYDEFRRFDKEYFDGQRAAQTQYQADIDALKEKGAINDQEYLSRSIKISKSRRELDLLERKTKQDTVSAIGDAFGNLSKIVGEDTKAGKAFAIAKTTIDTYQSAVSAYASLAGIPVVGPALGVIAAAAAVAAGIANVKKILAVQVPTDSGGTGGGTTPTPPPPPIAVNAVKRAQGGYVYGQGGQQSDSISAMLSNGEFVVNSRSSKMFGPLLETINSYGAMPQFAAQSVGSSANNNLKESRDTLGETIARTLQESPIKTYVTATEISNQQQFDRVIRQRSII